MDRHIHIPSSGNDNSDSTKTTNLQGGRCIDSSMATNSSVVHRTVRQIYRTCTHQRTLGSKNTRSRRTVFMQWIRKMDRISFLTKILTKTRSKAIATNLIQAYRKSSTKQAEASWKAFKNWLPDNAITITKKTILTFLLHAHDTLKLSPRTVLSYKSSLTWPIGEAFGVNFKDKDFNLLIKSLFLQNPPIQQKIPKWSLNHALERLALKEFKVQSSI